jgi:Raf kinase inhibitor-like YbhB/YbcL family protein
MIRGLITAITFLVLLVAFIGFGVFTTCHPLSTGDNIPNIITVTSTAFKDGEAMPLENSCDGINVSPQIAWTPGPGGTQFYALLMVDIDAPKQPFTHWVVYNIPLEITDLHAGISTNGILDTGSIQGRNDVTKLGYYGPCPMDANVHNYVFTIYAVDTYFQMPAAWGYQLVEKLQGHILAKGQLTGTYRR